jgi:hypothetical protein
MLFTSSGKKVMIAVMIAAHPKPNQMTNSGATAIFGSDCSAMMG